MYIVYRLFSQIGRWDPYDRYVKHSDWCVGLNLSKYKWINGYKYLLKKY